MNNVKVLRSANDGLVGDGAWAVGGTTVTVVMGTAANVVLARLLSPEDLGGYLLAFGTVVIFASIARLGLDVAVVRFVAQARSEPAMPKAGAAIRAVLRVGSLSGCIWGAALGLFGFSWIAENWFDFPQMTEAATAVGLWTAAEAIRLVASEAYRGFQDFPRATLFGNGTRAALFAVPLTVVALSGHAPSLLLVMWLATIASVVTLAGAVIPLRRVLRTASVGTPMSSSTVLGVGIPIMVAVVGTLGLVQADIWVVGSTASASDVAVYGAAARMVWLLALPLVVVNAVIAPRVVELRRQGRLPELQDTLRSAASVAAVPVVLVLALMAAFGGVLLEIVYGPFYRQGWLVLLLLAGGQTLNVGLGSCGTALFMTGRERLVMAVTAGITAVTLASEFMVAAHYGITGIAFCAAAGLAVLNCVLLVLARRHVGVWTHAFISPKAVVVSLRRLRRHAEEGL
jgi:O-antigen/teichoic acid export membrane protein